MQHCLNNFSTTDIHMLEYGLRRITKEQDTFSHNFYHRLIRDHHTLNSWLRTMGTESFGKCLIQCLESTIREFRIYGELITPPKNFWPEISSTLVISFEPSNMNTLVETFLDLVAKLHGDDWSPALEFSWRKASKTGILGLWDSNQDSSTSSIRFNSETFLSNNKIERSRHQTKRWQWSPVLLVAGSIAALSLLIRCHMTETKITHNFHFSECS